MPASFGYSEADVVVSGVAPDVEDETLHSRVTVLVRNGQAKVRTRSGSLLRERSGVLTAEKLARGAWLVTFNDGETWQVNAIGKRCSACGA